MLARGERLLVGEFCIVRIQELSLFNYRRFENEKSNEIQELKNEINELKSRALVNPKKITDKQINEVKKLRALGLSYRKISQKTSLGTTTICRIINGYYD